MWDLGLFFAIEGLEPEVGSVEANQVSWDLDLGLVRTPIELKDCRLVSSHDGQPHQQEMLMQKAQLLQGRKQSNFLCPVNVESMPIQGDY